MATPAKPDPKLEYVICNGMFSFNGKVVFLDCLLPKKVVDHLENKQ